MLTGCTGVARLRTLAGKGGPLVRLAYIDCLPAENSMPGPAHLQMEQERRMVVAKSGRLLEALREAHGEDGRPDLMFERRRR